MIPWVLLDSAQVPGSGGELRLYQRGEEFSIRIVGHGELMNSRIYASEDALAELSCARLAHCAAPRMLIGGLGMGYTLATALRHLGAGAEVVMGELVPAVVAWNRGPLGHLAGHPLRDARVTVREEDVGAIVRAEPNAWDAIVLDVDNGPEGLTRRANDWLYGTAGLAAAHAALRPRGVLAVWSAGPSAEFVRRMNKAGFEVDEQRVRARKSKGSRYVVWLGRRG